MEIKKYMSSLISIIVPCYNQAEYLEEALDSVFAQSYQNWECIIINDGSQDNTESAAIKWCKKDKRFKYLNKVNGGLSSARNKGIENALGEYILPLDADDLIHSEYLEIAIHSFATNNSLNLVYCNAYKFGLENGEWDTGMYDYRKLLLFNHIFCSAIYRKQDWMRVGGYDEQLKSGWEDWAFWIKLLNKDSIVHKIPKILFYYRTKQSSMLKNLEAIDQEAIKWHIYINNWEIYQQFFISPIALINENLYLKSLVERTLSTNSFRIGNLLLSPFSYFKNIYQTLKR